jgi:hypothetical protein
VNGFGKAVALAYCRSFRAQSLQHELHGVIEAAASLAKPQ